jgi:hypothetical protein
MGLGKRNFHKQIKNWAARIYARKIGPLYDIFTLIKKKNKFHKKHICKYTYRLYGTKYIDYS